MDDVREKLAALEHEQWAHWTRHMLDQICIEGNYSGEFWHLPCVARWLDQMGTPYQLLTEREKDSDRQWADRVIEVIDG